MVDDTLPRKKLGRTDLFVTPICFGTSALGGALRSYGYEIDEEQAHETLLRIFAGPVNFIDTSRNYGLGRSEERIGRVIRQLGGVPPGFVISTKIDADNDDKRFDGDQARRSIEESATALGVDRFQLVHLHDPEKARSLDEVTQPGGALDELFAMKEEGLVEAVGLAAGEVDVMMPMLRERPFDVVLTHNQFTLANRNAEEMIDFAKERGMAVLNAAPYNGGVFAKGLSSYPRYAYNDVSEEQRTAIETIEAACARHGVPVGAAALQFSLREPRVTATICGVTKPERVEQTLEWAKWPIPNTLWTELAPLGDTQGT